MPTVDAKLLTHYGQKYQPEQNPTQFDFHTSQKKYRVYIAGVNSGKSTAAAMELIDHALRYPGSRNLVARWSMASLRDSSWQVVKGILHHTYPGLIVDLVESTNRMEITLPHGSIIKGFHLQNWIAFGGVDLSTFWIDEVTELIDRRAYDMLCARIGRWDKGPPGGRGWVTGMSNGRDWVYNLAVTNRPDNYSFHHGKTTDNLANIAPDYIQDLYRQWGREKADMLINASFDVCQGLVFDNFDQRIHLVQPFKIPEEWPVYVGIDPGKRDPTAAVFVAADPGGNYYIFDCFYETGLDIPSAAAGILKKAAGRNVRFFVIDPSAENKIDASPVSRMQQYQDAGIRPLRAAARDFEGSLEHMYTLFSRERPKLFIFRNRETRPLVEELGFYHYPDTGAAGLINRPRPVDRDNHAIDASRYVLAERPAPAAGAPRVRTPEDALRDAFWADINRLGKQRPTSDYQPRGSDFHRYLEL